MIKGGVAMLVERRWIINLHRFKVHTPGELRISPLDPLPRDGRRRG
jgi:hypothetical protein